MSEFDLDLGAVEDRMAEGSADDRDARVVLGVLDGSTPDGEWVEAVEDGAVLVLAVEGDLNSLAAGFAREIRDAGGELIHFRHFLIVTPPGVGIDAGRLD
jgi:hypothetical protein